MSQEEILLEILLDEREDLGTRDDAAMDIGDVGTHKTFERLVKFASNPNEDSMLLESCGESIAEIFCRDFTAIQSIAGPFDLKTRAYGDAESYIAHVKPEYLPEFQKMFRKP